MINNIEIYSFEDEVWYSSPSGHKKLVAEDRDFIREMISKIEEFYPEAYKELCQQYSKCAANLLHYQYKIVWRFCKCNFGVIDNVADIAGNGKMNFEHVACPLRGECKGENVICHPRFNAKISESEKRVLKLLYNGMSKDNIADELCLSVHTVNNHIRNAYQRIGIHEKAEFIKYVNDHKLWEQE